MNNPNYNPQAGVPRSVALRAVFIAFLLAANWLSVQAQEGNCTATVLNRSVQLGPGGTIAIPNVPVQLGYFRVRVTCTDGGVTTVGQSDYFQLNPNGPSTISPIHYGQISPLPISIAISAPQTTLTTKGQTVQLTGNVTFANGSTTNASGPSTGTLWISSNPNIASITPNGLVTAVARGTVIIQAINEGVQSSIQLTMLIPNDADNDGITDEYERDNGLNPNDPSDAAQDPDGDGLTNLQEFQRGTNPRAADTDGDGLLDGQEIARGTNPLLADTDGDGLSDGQEVLRGSNPLARDTDGDGIPDGLEIQLGLSLTNPNPVTVVEGRVLDTSSTPVAGAAVTLFNLITVNSDTNGFFSIPNVPAGLGLLTVAAQIVRAGQILDGSSSPTTPNAGGLTSVGNIQIGLNAGTIAGVITDPFGIVVPGALVTVTAGADVRNTTANGAGQYRISNMTAGNLVITARDYRTGLRGRAIGNLPLNNSAVINLQLGPFGTVRGTVFGRDNITPVGAGATVAYFGLNFQQINTDPFGKFNFEFVPIGSYSLDASDVVGNHGRSGGDISATAQVNVNDIGYLGAGQVFGTVRDAALNPVANAALSLNSGSVFGGSANATADGAGRFVFSNVLIGTYFITAQAPGSGLAGQANGSILSNGQRVTNNITVAAAGSITGLVFRADGTTPVTNVQVTVSPAGFSASSGAQGQFGFSVLPLGSYTLSAIDPATGDRGAATATISSQGQVSTADITLNGLGNVLVTVRDGASNLVAGAQVNLQGTTQFGGSKSGMTAANGTVTFTGVLAGGFNISATDPVTGFGGQVPGNVGVGATALVTVRLQSFGSVAGLVFQPDGTTPAGGITVRLFGQVSRSTTTAADGSFRFDTVPTSTYFLDASDSGGVRARESGVVLSSQGQVATRNLTLIGLGTVQGTVSNPDASPAVNVGVSLVGQASGFARSFFRLTDINGHYSVSDVPVGPFTVTSSGQTGNSTYFGTAQGSIASHAQVVTANIQLSTSVIPLNPGSSYTSLYDANNFGYQLREDGAIQDGTPGGMWGGDFAANRGAFLLDLIVGGTTNHFNGQAFGSAEDGGREIVIQQNGLAGLNVTRKIFVPRDGYFTRYLESFSNSSNSPVTVGVRLTSNFRFIQKVQNGFNFQREPRIVSTSSGDALLSLSDPNGRDHWVTIDDDEDADPFLVGSSLPVVGDLFEGPGGAAPVSSADYNIDFTARYGKLVENWTNLTVAPGATVTLMHFGFEQITRSTALASAQRLAQLPPEALAGMTLTEMGQVLNFAVPNNGVSPLPTLPPLNGSISGRTLAGDGSNIVANATVHYQSTSPYFGRTWTFNANGAGQFGFTGSLNGYGNSFPVPVENFTLNGVHPLTGIVTPQFLGTFPSGLLVTTRDVIFSDTGVLAGTVRRHNNVVVSSGTVRISGGGILNPVTVSIAANGTFGLSGLPAGLYTLTATAPVAQGSDLTASTSVTILAGQTVNVNLAMPETGTITGLISRQDSSPGVNSGVQLHGTNGLSRSTTADTGGRYTFFDVPVGPVSLDAFDPLSNTAARAQTNTVVDQTVVANMTLISGGTVAGLVTSSGQIVTNAQVTVIANNGTFTTATGSDGRYTFFPVEPGAVKVQAIDPLSSLRGLNSGTLNNSGSTLTLDIPLFASGTITGLVYRTDGVTPIPNAPVTLSGSTFRSTVSGAQGQYSFDVVPLGSFAVTASNPANNENSSVNGTLSANLQTLSLNLVMKPNISINNSSVTERNVGTTNATFSVTLSSPSLQEVRVNFATANNSAVVGDYVSASGTVIFAPGITSQPINITIIGDVAIEPTETFVVNLFSPVNGNISDSQGLGTILNDDGFAGRVDHFAWNSIPSVQFINESFPVTVLAQDAFDNVVTDFAGPVTLTGITAAQDLTVGNGNTAWNFPFASFYHDARLQSIYLSGELGSARTITGLALDVTGVPGQTLTSFTIRLKHTASTSYGPNPVWESAGWTTVLQTNLTVSATGSLVLPFAVPFNYNGVDNLMIDFSFNNNFYSGDGSTRSTDTALNRSIFFRTDSGAGDPLAWSGTSPTPGVIARVPNIRLLGSEAGVVMTPAVSGSFSNGIWSGNVTVQQLATNLILRANDGDGHLGNSVPVDVLVHNDLALSMVDSPDPVQVGSQLTYTLTVTNTGPQSATSVVVTNILPASATFVSAVLSQGTFSNTGGTVRCNLGTIPGATSALITIVATPTAIGNITNRASLSRAEADPYPANDRVEAVTTVLVPSLTIADVSGAEGNSTSSAPVFVFAVRLSYPNSQTVTVNYASSNGTALATSDYVATNGVLTFLPGETNKTIGVRIVGDTFVEPNETFFVNLSTPVNATLAANQGIGTIVNDDGLPGQIDHFDWAAIASPQFANEPFAVTIMAKDGAGTTVSNFTGPVTLSAFTGSSISNRILGDLSPVSSGNSGAYTLGYSFTPNTNLTVTHVRHQFGNKVSIWTDSGVLLASQNVVSTPGTWVETPLAAPLSLNAGVTYRVAAYTESTYYYRFDGGSTFSNGVINASYQQPGDGYPNFSDGVRWWLVDLRYNVGNQVPTPIAPAISGTFSNGVWNGTVTLSTLSTNATLAANDGDGHSGQSTNFVVLFHNDIAINVSDSPDPVGAGTGLAYTVTVTNTGPSTATGVLVTNQLAASVSFGSANISQGSTSVSGRTVTWNVGSLTGGAVATMVIQATPTASGIITNNAGVTRAEADAFAGNNFFRETTTVLLPTLTITGTNVVEGNFGIQNVIFAVQLSYPSPQTVQVNFNTTNGSALAGSDYVQKSGTLTFAPGQTATNIIVGVIGETVIETNETFFVNLSAPVNATLAVPQASALILNDDGIPGQVDHFDWAAIASPQFTGEAFPVTVTAKDSFGDTVTDFSGPVTLSGSMGGGAATNRILGDLVNESFSSGNYTLGYAFTPTTNIVVTHVRHYFGTKVSIWTDTGVLLASQSVSSSPGSWTETPLTTPITLTNGIRYRVAAYTGGGNYYYRFSGLATFPNGTIDSNNEQSGDNFPANNSGSTRWLVDLRYTVGNSIPLPISPTVSGTFIDGVWTGAMNIQAQADNAVLRADDGNGHAGDSNPILVVRQNDLSVTVNAGPLPADVRSNLIYSITVTNTGPAAATAVIVSNTLPAEVNFISAIASQGSVVRAGRLVMASLGSVPGGGTATVTIVVKPALDSIVVSNLCNIARGEADADLSNNSVLTAATVRALFGGGGRVAVFAADNATWYEDARLKIQSTGLFTGVDAFNVTSGNPVPTLSQLSTYDAVMVYDDFSFNNTLALGNVLADYVDSGGGLVVATFAYQNSSFGRLSAGNYLPFTTGGGTSASFLTMLKDDPQHPILDGVNTFNGGSSSYHNFVSLASGATLIAHWSNNRPLVATRQTANGRVVGLNFFPPSNTQRSDFWQANTDGARLMANALGWAAPGAGNVPDDLALSVTDAPDPVAVGNNVTYTLNITNSGPSAATGVLVTNIVPAGGSLVSFASSQGTITETNGVVVGNLGTLAGGSNATITVVMHTVATGTLTNVANVVRAEPDGYLRNNLVVSRTTVQVPTLSIDDLTITEGDSGQTNANFVVRLSIPSPQPVSVVYTTFNGSAVNGADYLGTNGVLVFAPGETNRTISVQVINDLLNEASESFFVSLAASTNAIIADNQATGTILDNDPLPALSISDAQLTERNSGISNAVFIVTLSSPSGQTVTVNFTTANDTAVAGSDYVPTNGVLVFNAGETNKTIAVGVIGDSVIETNETFFVNLFSPANATLNDSQGVGTILNDDGLPGQIDRLEWASIPSPQFVNEPFGVTITAKDAFGTTLTGFNGPVTLSGFSGVSQPTQRILGNVTHNNSFSGNYTVGYSFTPNTNLVVTHVRHYSGIKVSIWTDTGILIVSQPVVSVSGTWTETPLAEPVTLQAGVRYRVATYNLSDINYYRFDLPTQFSNGTIQSSYYVFGDGFPANSDSPHWYFVDLAYAPGSTAAIPISPAVTSTFTNGIWSGNLTVQAPAEDVVLRASDGDGHVGKADRISVQLRNDLGIRATVAPTVGDVRSNLIYSIVVSNTGPDSVTAVTVTNLLPAEVNLLSVTTSQGSFSSAGRMVTCNLGTLSGAGFAGITIVTKPNADGLITNVVSVGGAVVEPYLLNNTATIVTRIAPPSGGEFRILNLSANGSFAIEHNTVTGDDRGGIVASDSHVFVTGDNSTAYFNLTDLSGGTRVSGQPIYDGMVSDLQSQKIYLLGNGTTRVNSGLVTTLIELDGATGLPTGDLITLSSSIPLSSDTGIFSGYGRIVLHTGNHVYHITVPSGVVADLGNLSSLSHQFSESWAYWGIAENFDDAVYLVYVQNSQTIVRTRVSDGATSVVANFANLSDMASITLSIPRGRWYFHHEGTSQFRSGDETVGYADATFHITGGSSVPDDVALTVDYPPGPISVGSQVTYMLNITNSGPTTATGVIVTNLVPAGFNIVTLSSSQGTVNANSGTVIAELGSLAGGTTATVTIVAQVLSGGTFTNEATVVRAEPDGYTPNNNVSSITTAIMPMISVQEAMVQEGDAGTTPAIFQVSLFPASEQTVSFDFATMDKSAKAGSDYQSASGTITFNPGETNRTIAVLVNGDTAPEPVESFLLQFFNPTNALLSAPQVQGLILNDDLSSAVYLRSEVGLPWFSTQNEAAMDRVFGDGNWQDLRYESVIPESLLSTNTSFIFMEGGDSSTPAFGNFLTNNLAAIQNWVTGGGRLFLNAAPNDEAVIIQLGFGTTLVYPDNTANAEAVDSGHLIFSGPFTPVDTFWTGSPFAQATISGNGLTSLIRSLDSGRTILAETQSAAGIVLFGGMLPDDYINEQPEGANLRANIIAYASSVEITGGGLPILAARSLRVSPGAPLELEVTGKCGEICVIEASTDMIHWTPVCTNCLSSNCLKMNVPAPKDSPRGFYRARWKR